MDMSSIKRLKILNLTTQLLLQLKTEMIRIISIDRAHFSLAPQSLKAFPFHSIHKHNKKKKEQEQKKSKSHQN